MPFLSDDVKDLLDKTLVLVEAVAKYTDNKYDDQVTTVVRAVFDQVFGPRVFAATLESVSVEDQAREILKAQGVPAWLVPLLFDLVVKALKKTLGLV